MLTLIQRSVCYSVFFACFISWTSICSDAERLFHRRDHSDLQSENQQRAEPITDPHTAEMFLSRYGFLRPVNWEEMLLDDREETDLSFLDLHEFSIEEGASLPHSRQTDQNHHHDQKPHDPHFARALRDFQKRSGLPVTGVLDEATKDAMNRPRCGVPDVEAELGDESSGDEPWQVEITDDESLQEKPNSESVGFQHLDDVEMLDKNLKDSDSNSSEGDMNNQSDDLSEETNYKFAGNLGSTENHMSNETKIETHKQISDLKTMKNVSATLENAPSFNDSYNGSRAFEDDLPSTDHETNQKFTHDFKLLDVLLGRMDKKATEPEGFRFSESNTFTNFTNGDSNMTFANYSVSMSNLTFIDRSDTDDSETGNLNQTFRSTNNHSDGYLLNNNSTDFSNETNVLFMDNLAPNLNRTATIKASGNSAVANLTFENETAFDDNHNRFGDLNDFSFSQRVNDLKDYDTGNITFSDDFTPYDPVSKDAAVEKMLQSAYEKAFATKENSTIDNVHFENFTNETNLNSLTVFDPIDNDTSIETKHQAVTKQLIKTKESSTIINVNLENKNGTTLETKHQTIAEKLWNLSNETNSNSPTIIDSIDNDTSVEDLHQNLFKTAFESKKDSTVDDLNFENFSFETNLNSSIIFDPINSDTSMHQKLDKTAIETKENSTIDNVRFENFTNKKSLTIFDPIDKNGTTLETKHQSIAKKCVQTKENSTVDSVNVGNFINETNLNSSTIFDPIDNNTILENFTKTKGNVINVIVNFEKLTNEKNLNSPTVFDSIDHNTTVKNIHQNVNQTAIKTKKMSTFDNANFENFTNETNLNSLTIFDSIDSNTTVENVQKNVNKTQTKEIYTNFTNETNLNSQTIFDKTDNATSAETKHQTIAKKPTETTELAQNSDVARRKRHLATLVSKSHARKRRDLGGHVAFSKSVLRWRLMGEGYSSQLSVEEQRYVFRLAFRMWSEVCPLEFTEDNASPLEEVDIRLGFGTGRHLGCKQRFDGSGREFAHAWFLGDIHFDDDEHFTGSSAGRGISLLKVAVHEIGHVLGLPHIYRPGSIMQPSYRPHESGFEVDWMDRKAIQSLYGGCKGRFDAVFDWVRRERSPRGDVLIRFNTYFLRRGWYWLYENRNNRTRFGDPVSLQSGWRGLPLDGVDAFVHVWSRRRDHAYFFKGAQFWRYDGEQDQVLRRDPDGRSYPRPISEGFPGVPAPIDTAVYDRRDGNIYFFKGRLVYAFSVDSNRLARGFPRPLRSVFPPALDPRDHPESGLDAAYFSYTHNALFLLKDTRFWRVAGARERRTGPRLRKNSLLPHREVDQQWFDICNVHPTVLRLNP